MRIGLIDVDGHNWPNIALMKISAYHKSIGDHVEWWDGFSQYDRVYMSRVFDDTYSEDEPEPCNAAEIIKGGTGYGLDNRLPDEIEHIMPDYGLYHWMPQDTAYGFLTRGCVNRCSWCVVPHKEGEVRAHADIEEFLDGRKRAVLLDNNVLASEWGLMQIEKIVRMGIRVDFNQGLDARRIARTPEIAALLARVKWIRFLRMAYDSRAMQDDVHKAIELLRKHGVPARRLFFYVLIRDDTEDALGRIRELKALGCQPFAQPYRDFEHEGKPSWEQWRLAYWCNRKPLFHSVDYEEYRKNRT